MASSSTTDVAHPAGSDHRAKHRPARRPGDGRPDLRIAALVLVGAWALTISTYLLHVAWVLPPLILFGTAALMRGGRSLLDRIMMALALLFGATCAFALLFSVWPFGLHPVPIAGLAFTGLIGFSFWANRRPVLPRPGFADALSFAAATTVALIVAFPLYAEGQSVRVGIFMAGEDGVRHFTVFDAVRQVGGYLFLHWDESLSHLYQGMITYPQGSHLLFGLLDGFVRSSASDYGTGLSALDHYQAFTVLAYAVFALALIWAVQWLAEPMLNSRRRVALVAVAFAFVLSSESFQLVLKQYVGQTAGLTLMVLLIAVLARPPARTRQAMLLIASLLFGLGFTYYLYLPAAGVAVLSWLIIRRAQVRRHPILLGLTLVAAIVALVPAAVGLVVGRQDLALLATNPAASRDGLILLAALAATGLFSARTFASPIWRMYRWALLAAVVAWMGLLATQFVMAGGVTDTSFYYAIKAQDLVSVTLVLSLGALLGHLPPPGNRVDAARRSRAATAWVPAVGVAVALAAGSGLIFGDSPLQTGGSVTPRAWVTGSAVYNQFAADAVLSEVARRESKPGTVTIVMGEDANEAYYIQLLLNAVQRTSGFVGASFYTAQALGAPDRWDGMVEALAPRPVLIIVDTSATEARAKAVRDRHPGQDITIARMYQ